MGLLIVRHKVKNFAAWKNAFEGHAAAQKSAGLTNPRLYRSADDSNETVVLFGMRDVAEAKKFAAGPDLKTTMAASGVVDQPTA